MVFQYMTIFNTWSSINYTITYDILIIQVYDILTYYISDTDVLPHCMIIYDTRRKYKVIYDILIVCIDDIQYMISP